MSSNLEIEMRKIDSWLLAIVASVALSGCLATAPRGSGQAYAQDAVIGGLLGYALTGDPGIAVITGIAGIVVGDGMRRQMDERDQRRVVGVTRGGIALPHGHYHEDHWRSGEYQYRSRVTPGPRYHERERECRLFTQRTEVYGRHGQVIDVVVKEGVACLDRRGNWVIQR
jgi:surface antigen